MSQTILMKLDIPSDLEKFELPVGVNERLHYLLDKQDREQELTVSERKEAEGLVNIAELLSLLKLRVINKIQEEPSTQ